jgi:hypothetical protein
MSSLESKAFWVKVPIIGGNPNVQVVTLEFAQKEIERLNQAYLLLNNSLSECAKKGRKYLDETENLEAKVEATNKLLNEKIKAWDEAYSLEANDLQWEASRDLGEVKALLIPRKELQSLKCDNADNKLGNCNLESCPYFFDLQTYNSQNIRCPYKIQRKEEANLLDEAHEGCPGCHKPVQDCTCKYPIKEEAAK